MVGFGEYAFKYLVIQCIIDDFMAEVSGILKKWGNSFGIIIPNETVKKERLKEGQKINVILLKKSDVLKKTFGTWKTGKSAQEIKDELRKELYDD